MAAFNSVKTESKAVKVLGAMFTIFVTCWAPFFTVNLIMGVCSSCYVDPLLFKVTYLYLPVSTSSQVTHLHSATVSLLVMQNFGVAARRRSINEYSHLPN